MQQKRGVQGKRGPSNNPITRKQDKKRRRPVTTLHNAIHNPQPLDKTLRKIRRLVPKRPLGTQSDSSHAKERSNQRTIGGCWVGRTPNRALLATLAPENLSSGEKRAGWADSVRLPAGFAFWRRNHNERTSHTQRGTNTQTGIAERRGSGCYYSGICFPAGTARCVSVCHRS